jgi:hypothetical protein
MVTGKMEEAMKKTRVMLPTWVLMEYSGKSEDAVRKSLSRAGLSGWRGRLEWMLRHAEEIKDRMDGRDD